MLSRNETLHKNAESVNSERPLVLMELQNPWFCTLPNRSADILYAVYQDRGKMLFRCLTLRQRSETTAEEQKQIQF